MKNVILVFATFFALANVNAQCKLDYSNYHLIFEDEFNYQSQSAMPTDPNNPAHYSNNFVSNIPYYYTLNDPTDRLFNWGTRTDYYTDQTTDPRITFDNGIMLITEKPVDTPYDQIDSANLDANGNPVINHIYYKGGTAWLKFDFDPANPIGSNCDVAHGSRGAAYGMFEARFKAAPSNNVGSAFWLTHGAGNNEIDIKEGQDNEMSNNVIDWFPDPNINCQHTYWPSPYDGQHILSDDFHVYTAVWTPEQVTFFLDGRELRTVKSDQVPLFPCSVYIIFNVLDRAGYSIDSAASMAVDYVRVYKPNNGSDGKPNYNLPYKTSNEWIHHKEKDQNNSYPTFFNAYQSIALNTNTMNDLYAIKTDSSNGDIYQAHRNNNNSWTTQNITATANGRTDANWPAHNIAYNKTYDCIVYVGHDALLYLLKKTANGIWNIRPLVSPSITTANSVWGSSVDYPCIAVAGDGDIVYNRNDNKMVRAQFVANNSPWTASVIGTYPASGNYCKGDIQLGNTVNTLFYKAADNRLQAVWYNPSNSQYENAIVDATSPYNYISDKPGSLTLKNVPNNHELFYIGTDDKVHHFYYSTGWTHELIPFSYGSDLVRDNIFWDGNNGVGYNSYSGRAEFFNKPASTWQHGYVNDYWNTVAYSSYGGDGSNSGAPISNMLFDPAGYIYYLDNWDTLCYFKYEPCDIEDPGCTTNSQYYKQPNRNNNGNNILPVAKSSGILTIYPNPANDQLHIANAHAGDDISFRILNVMGQEVKEGRYNSKSIDISALSPGMYTISLTSPSGRSTYKFVKQ